MIALIDYGAGNTASVANALNELNVEYKITKRELDITSADKIIFPGVGEATYAVKQLHFANLFNLLRIIKKPLLGICLGMQMLCEKSKEGDVACLGIFPESTELFNKKNVNVPHMGWNKVDIIKESKLFLDIDNNEQFYFANSYYVPKSEHTTGTTLHDIEFAASIEKDNFYGVQFHPEKSGVVGIKLLKNFIERC
ncbi:MAG: imidazole glycerol phosphate synthase subunit HisH [Melioribacteraceae bacterium]|nr:imidazole glycerol phosphate synthase subunit HisH [Melioribacteraceae bacterium]